MSVAGEEGDFSSMTHESWKLKGQENWLEDGRQKISGTLTKLAVSGKVFLR